MNANSNDGLNETCRALVLLVVSFFVIGCNQYGEVSPKAYQISSALYSVCNRKDESRLGSVEQLIADAATAEELSSSEHDWLLAIVEAGRGGNWDSAAKDARRMMEEQIQ